MDIRLRPLEQHEFRAFLDALRVEYVRGLVEDARMPTAEAERKAAADHASLFPDGAPQPNHRISLLVDGGTGERRGYVFWALRRPPEAVANRAYLYELFVDEPFRRRGVGRRALELLEDEVRAAELPGIDLNVWGGNDTARALYRSAGFEERAVFMSKELA